MYDLHWIFNDCMTSQFLCILRISIPLPPGSTAACSASATSMAHQLPQACVVPPSGINHLVASEILNAFPWPLPCSLVTSHLLGVSGSFYTELEWTITPQNEMKHPLRYQRIRMIQPRNVEDFTP